MALLELMLEVSEAGVWEWDLGTNTVTWSAQMERLAGLDEGSYDGTFDTYLSLIHPDDRDRVVASIDASLEGGQHLIEHRFLRPDGSTVWIEGRGAVVQGDDGEVVGMVGMALDVSHRVQRRRQLELERPLVEELNVLSDRLHWEHDRTAQALLVVDFARKACGASAAAVLERSSVLHPWSVLAGSGAGAAELVAAAEQAGDLVFRDHGRVDDTLVVPIAPQDADVGDIVDLLVVAEPSTELGATAEHLAVGAAAHAATAFANSRFRAATIRELRARQEAINELAEVTAVLQRSLLPPDVPSIAGLDLAARYLPMTTGIGGDFYDVFGRTDDRWAVVLGDVCGKGPAAAVVTGLVRHSVRASAMAGHTPPEVIEILNQAMIARAERERTFCTLVYGQLELVRSGCRLQLSVAGHPPALVLRSDGSVERHGPTGHLVGMFDEIALGELTIDLAPGDTCVLYTDGATDVRRGDVEFGEDRLLDIVASCRDMTAAALAHSVERAVVDFQRGDIADDLAIVAIRVPPSR